MKQLLFTFLGFIIVNNIEYTYSNSQIVDQHKFVLILSLYNETDQARMQEYITCLENNLKHNSIKKIHILYDIAKDDQKNELFNYLKTKPVAINLIKGRPTFGSCFNFANSTYPNSKIILSNADIYFNETLALLDTYDLINKFLALTRWDVQKDGSLKIFKQSYKEEFDLRKSSTSQDVWIFETPLKKFKRDDFQLGTFKCDSAIAYQAWDSKLEVINPCLSIQCCHLHLSQIRNWINQKDPEIPYKAVFWDILH